MASRMILVMPFVLALGANAIAPAVALAGTAKQAASSFSSGLDAAPLVDKVAKAYGVAPRTN